MVRRLALWSALMLAVMLALPAGAGAVTIQRELQEIMTQKDGELIPVLMVFDDYYDFSQSEALEMLRDDPDKRRGSIIAALKKRAKKNAHLARQIIEDPANLGLTENVQLLYLANALAFRADPRVLEQLAADKATSATLVYDKPRDLTDLTDARVAPAAEQDGVKRDPAANVWSVEYIEADRVWDELGFTGAGVLVGHIDSGVWLTHPDLANRIYQNPGEIPSNGIDDDGNGYIDDVHGWDFGDNDNDPNDDNPSGGHGTHTAGTVCGDGSGGTRTGVAPGAQILPCKVFATDGTGNVGMIWGGQQYAVEMGVRLMTMSLGVKGDDLDPSLLRAERYNSNAIREAGVVVFNSAGNEHFEFDPPFELGMTARVPAPWYADPNVAYSHTSGVITVGGTGYQNNVIYSASSRGPADWDYVEPWNDWPYNPGSGLTKPDVAAPGTNVNSTVRPSGYSGDSWSGTSMSCPHAAGVAALMLEKNPSLSPAGIDSLMEQSALDLGAAGKDNDFGSGLINAYDAVVATPLTETANLIQTAVLADPGGDAVLDPGQVSEIAFELTNISTFADATNVQATLTVRPNAHVTVVDGTAVFPDIAADFGTGDNLADTFSLNVAAAAPQGYPFELSLRVTCDGGFVRTFDIDYFAGLPEFLTHDVGGVFGTVTDQGIIGFMSDDQTQGRGFGAAGAGNALFVGSFWAGSLSTYVCNRDYHGQGAGLETYEWVTRQSPNGRMRDLGAQGSDQTFTAAFTDSGHADPKNILVEQTSYAWAQSPDDEFVIIEYHVTNNGSDLFTNNYWTGVFCDWDIGDAAANIGSVDVGRHAIYLHPSAGGGPYYGLALVGGDMDPENITFVHNPTYVYPNAAIEDGFKLRFLRSLITLHDTPAADDWSMVCSAGPVDLDPGVEATAAYAMVYGETLSDFLANVDAAVAAYDPTTPVSDQTPLKVFRLAQNQPNPFNPVTTLKYDVASTGHVELAVFDVSGKLIRTLVSDSRAAGQYEVVWDGTDDAGQRVSSGVYFAKYRAGDQQQTRKMMMVK